MAHSKPERLLDKLPRIKLKPPYTKPIYMTYGAIAGLVVVQSFNAAYLLIPKASQYVSLPLLVGLNAMALCIPLASLVRVVSKPSIPSEDDEHVKARIGRHRRTD